MRAVNPTALDNFNIVFPTSEQYILTEQEIKDDYAEAANRWNRYIQLKSINHSQMRAARPGWNGLEIKELEFFDDPDRGYIAAAGGFELLRSPDWCCYTYKLFINAYWYRKSTENNFAGSNWLSKESLREKMKGTLLHEIGHALGITIATDSYYRNNVNNLLVTIRAVDNQFFNSASATEKALEAYGSIIPLQPNDENDNDGVAHYSSVARTNSNTGITLHPGAANEPNAVPQTSEKRIITPLTIGYLKDLGYEEVSTGSSEGAISFNNSTSASFIEQARAILPNLPDNFRECGS